MAQYARERNVEEKQSKRYFTASTLEELITSYPVRRKMNEAEQQREYQSRIALIDFLRGLLHLDPGRRWSPQQAIMHPFITGEPFNMSYVPAKHVSGDIHGSGNASGPFGGSAHGSGGYSNPGTSGYQSQGAGSNGGGGGNLAGGGGFSSMNMTVGRSAGYQTLVAGPDSNGLGTAAYDSGQSIPGSFPIKNASNVQSHESSYAGSQSSRVDPSGTLGRQGMAAGGYVMSSAANAANDALLQSRQYAYLNQQQQQQQQRQNDFLDVDPCTSLINELLAADGDSFDGPGRSRVSLGGSEYSAESGFGWAIRSETNNNNNNNSSAGASNPLSIAGSLNTRASSLYDYKPATAAASSKAPSVTSGGSSLAAAVATASTAIPQQHRYQQQRSYVLNERQQQRMIQQRYLQHGELGSDYSPHHLSDGYGSSDMAPLPGAGGNFSQGGTLVGSKDKASMEHSSCQSAISSDMSLRGTPGPLAGGAAGTFTVSAAASSANFISIGMTDSSAASSVVGGNRLSSVFSSMRLRPSPAPRSSAGARLVSNFSPLTLPSTPGSFNTGLHRTNSMAETDDLYDQDAPDFEKSDEEDSGHSGYGDIEEYLEYEDGDEVNNSVDNDAESEDDLQDGSDASGSIYSDGSALSRPMTQAADSEKSLSMYSAISDRSGIDEDVDDDNEDKHSKQEDGDECDSDDVDDDDSYPSSVRESHAEETSEEYDGWSMLSEISSDGLSDSFSEHGFSDSSPMASFIDGPLGRGKQRSQTRADGANLFGGDYEEDIGGRSTLIITRYPSSELDFIEFKADESSKKVQTNNGWRSNEDEEDDELGLENDVDSRSVISQEDQSKYQGALTPGDLCRTTSFFGHLDIDIDHDPDQTSSPTLGLSNQSKQSNKTDLIGSSKEEPRGVDRRHGGEQDEDGDGGDEYGSGAESDYYSHDGIEFSALSRSTMHSRQVENKDSTSNECSDSSDADENGGGVQQDTILFTGKLNAKQEPASKDGESLMSVLSGFAHQRRQSNAVSPSPIPRSLRHSSIAEYPQRVMKRSQQQRRNERTSLQLKDNLRMVESLRRMGKWQDSAWSSSTATDVSEQISRANQFYFDPVIVCMSPRLVPQQPSGQQG
ncbi:dual specificity protein kinase yak1 [Coemansia sp. RSA 486]|nr:dual specificity protein kinase yak1 [Coemansia sp. RSA 486]